MAPGIAILFVCGGGGGREKGWRTKKRLHGSGVDALFVLKVGKNKNRKKQICGPATILCPSREKTNKIGAEIAENKKAAQPVVHAVTDDGPQGTRRSVKNAYTYRCVSTGTRTCTLDFGYESY